MSIVATLLDKARARKGIASDNALAQHLGTNRQVVSQWRHGDSYPSEDNIAELAEMAGDDPVQWLVAVKAVRSEGKARKAWAALAKRLAAVTAGIGVIALAYFHADAPGALMALVPVAVTDPLYIMRKSHSAGEGGRATPTTLDLALLVAALFGGHSLRSGFVTEASRQGVALPAIMQLTEHRSVSSVIGYFQTGGATANPAARLLED